MRNIVKILLVLALGFSFASARDFNKGDEFLMVKKYTKYMVIIIEAGDDYAKAVGVRVKKNGKMYKYEYTFTRNYDRDDLGVLYHVEYTQNGDRRLPFELLQTNTGTGTFKAGGFNVETGEFNFHKGMATNILKKL